MLYDYPFNCFSLHILLITGLEYLLTQHHCFQTLYPPFSFTIISIKYLYRFITIPWWQRRNNCNSSNARTKYSFFSPARGILEVLCPVNLALVCSWQEWSVGVMAAPAETSLAFTLQLLNSVAGSKKRRECNWDQ